MTKQKGKVGPVTLSAAGGAGVGGAITIILFWVLEGFWGITAPAEVMQATTTLITVSGAIIFGKVVPPKDDEPLTLEEFHDYSPGAHAAE